MREVDQIVREHLVGVARDVLDHATDQSIRQARETLQLEAARWHCQTKIVRHKSA